MDKRISECWKKEIEQIMASERRILKKDISPLERRYFEASLKLWEITLLELEKRMRNDEQICEQSENAGIQQSLGLQEE